MVAVEAAQDGWRRLSRRVDVGGHEPGGWRHRRPGSRARGSSNGRDAAVGCFRRVRGGAEEEAMVGRQIGDDGIEEEWGSGEDQSSWGRIFLFLAPRSGVSGITRSPPIYMCIYMGAVIRIVLSYIYGCRD